MNPDYDEFPLTSNNPAVTDKFPAAFTDRFEAEASQTAPQQTASEDFSPTPDAFGVTCGV